MNQNRLKIYTDGASRGNPGPASIGFLVLDSENKEVLKKAELVGKTTNNQAEYEAVIRALKEASELTKGYIDLFSDSQLLVKQLNGKWNVKDSKIKSLYSKVIELVNQFEGVEFHKLPRENSKIARADRLCNEKLDEEDF